MRDKCCAVGCFTGHPESSKKKTIRHPETRKVVAPEELIVLEDHTADETATPICSMHRPATESQRIAWLKNAKLYEEGQDLILCSRHFLPSCIKSRANRVVELQPNSAPTLFPTHTIDDRPPKRKDPEPEPDLQEDITGRSDGTLLFWKTDEYRSARKAGRHAEKQRANDAGVNPEPAVAAAAILAQAAIDGSVTVEPPLFPVHSKAANTQTPMFLPMGVENRKLPQVVIDRAYEAEYDVLSKQLATTGARMLQLADHHRQAKEHKKLLSYALNQIHCATSTPQARRFTPETFEFANNLLQIMRAGNYEEFRKQNFMLLPDHGAVKRWRDKNMKKAPPPPLDEIDLLQTYQLPALTMPPAPGAVVSSSLDADADSTLQTLLQRIVAGDIVLEH